jgi:hypothetical protein
VSEFTEAALAIWDQLAAGAKCQTGGVTSTELMLRTKLSRPEVPAGLKELAAAGWAVRRIAETPDRQLAEKWTAGPEPERHEKRRDRRELEAAE